MGLDLFSSFVVVRDLILCPHFRGLAHALLQLEKPMPLLKPDRDLLDVLPALVSLLSVVVAGLSIRMAADADRVGRLDTTIREAKESAVRAWDRDAQLIEKLTSGDPRERQYATLMIRGLEEQKAFSPELKSTLLVL